MIRSSITIDKFDGKKIRFELSIDSDTIYGDELNVEYFKELMKPKISIDISVMLLSRLLQRIIKIEKQDKAEKNIVREVTIGGKTIVRKGRF